MILGLFPGFNQTGGIQRISQHTAAILEEIAASSGQPCQLVSVNDSLGHPCFCLERREHNFRGFERDKLGFIIFVLCKTFRAKFIYIGHYSLAKLGLFMRILNPRLRYWVAIYGVETWQPLPPLDRSALYAAHGITALSQHTAQQLIKNQGLKANKIKVIPPALDPCFTTAGADRSGLPFPAEKKMILTVSRLVASEPGKGVDAVMRALPLVIKESPDVFYTVVGEGDERPHLERLAEELNVSDKVYFVGEKAGRELNEYYSRADVFAMPSRQEGLGIVFLEAMAFGKPVIGGDHGGTPDIVKDGVSGFLVKFGDIEMLANRLICLLKDERLRKRMGEAGKETVMANYTFGHFRSKLTEVLSQ